MQSEAVLKSQIAVMFDMDGVLCLGEKPFELAQRRALEEMRRLSLLKDGIDIDSEDFKRDLLQLTEGRSTLQIYREMTEKYFKHNGSPEDKKQVRQFFGKMVNRFNVEEIEIIKKNYLIMDTVQAFIECVRNNIPIAIVTGSLKPVAEKTRALIAELVTDETTREKILAVPLFTPEVYKPASKPQPDPYLKGFEHLSLHHEVSVSIVIEDSGSGIKSAVQGGFRTLVRTEDETLSGRIQAWQATTRGVADVDVTYHTEIHFDLICEAFPEHMVTKLSNL